MNQKLRYKTINNFINNLNTREKKYIIKKINENIMQEEFKKLDFVYNNERIKIQL